MAQAAQLRARLPLPNPGERWIKVSQKGQGLTVEILKVTELNVSFRVVKAVARHGSGDIAKLTIPQFITTYVRATGAAIVERQQELREQARKPRPGPASRPP